MPDSQPTENEAIFLSNLAWFEQDEDPPYISQKEKAADLWSALSLVLRDP